MSPIFRARRRFVVGGRLLGAGATLRAAIADLAALPPDAWERVTIGPLILQFRLALPAEPSQRTPDEEEFFMTSIDYVALVENQGKRALLARQVERRLRRPLSEPERATLQRRVEGLGAEQVGDIVIDLSPEALAGWLAEGEAPSTPSAE